MIELSRAILQRQLDPVSRLLFGQLLMFTGIAAVFPIAPLYVAHRGGSSVEVALFIAGPLVANAMVQIPAGHLTDRVGRKPVLIGTRLLSAVLALALFFDHGPLWLLALFRIAQGASGGAYSPALRAALTDLTEPERRGQRFAQLQACEMIGLLVGPAIGGAVALWRDNGIFLCSGIGFLLGVGALRRLPEPQHQQLSEPERVPAGWWRRSSLIVPCVGLLAVGAMFSMYDVVWPQYLSARGNSPLVIGLSISLYAIPILLLAKPAGRLSDTANRRLLVGGGLILVGLCSAAYPTTRTLWIILSIGTVEAIAIVVLEPTLFASIGDAAAPEMRGRAMGIGGLFQFGGSAAGAGLLGSLYGVREALPFIGGMITCALAASVCAVALPLRRPGLPPVPLPASAAVDLEART